jgi:DNA-binding IclR family transcriptional regulator
MVDRVATILEHVARNPEGTSLTDLARVVDAPVSSVQGLVNGLVATGYLDERDRRYALGLAPYLLNLLSGRRLVSAVTHADLAEIHAETGMTTVLSVVVGRDVFYVDYCSSDPAYAYLAENHIRRSLIRTSSGWVLLAGLGERDLWSYLRSLPPEDSYRVDAFLAALGEIRKTGLCATPNISEITGDGISVAVTENDRTVASVCVIDAPEKLERHRERVIAALTSRAARWNG